MVRDPSYIRKVDLQIVCIVLWKLGKLDGSSLHISTYNITAVTLEEDLRITN